MTVETLSLAMPFPVSVWTDYPNRWPEAFSSRVKTLLLFFDAIGALLTPSQSSNLSPDDELGQPMLEAGLLKLIDPEILVDSEMAISFNLALEAALDVLGPSLARQASERHSDIWVRTGTRWGSQLSFSRMGVHFQPDMVRANADRLADFGLAVADATGRGLTIARPVADLTTAILSELVRSSASRTMQLDVHAVSSHFDDWGKVERIGLSEQIASNFYGGTILGESRLMVPDLARVPLDEVIDFRAQHGASFREYVKSINTFCMELSLAPSETRAFLREARQQELADAAAHLADVSRLSWPGFLTSVGFGGAGIAWAASAHQDLWGAVLAAAGGLAGIAVSSSGTPTGPFRYLLEIHSQFGDR